MTDGSTPPKVLLDLAPSLKTPGFRLVDAGELYQLMFTLVGSKPGLTATGTNQATALQINAGVNEFSNVAAGTGALLPLGLPGQQIIVTNRTTTNALLVYPSGADTITPNNSSTPGTSLSVAAGQAIMLVCISKAPTGAARWKQIV